MPGSGEGIGIVLPWEVGAGCCETEPQRERNTTLSSLNVEKQKRLLRRVGPVRLIIGAVVLLVLGTVWMLFLTGRLMALEVLSNSMEPTIRAGDRMIVGRFTNGNVERGDLVIMVSPDDDGPDMVKRVVGLPGDQIRLQGGFLTINGEDTSIAGAPPGIHPGARDQDFVLEPGHYYLLGDNRANSHDSTEFGPIHRRSITGRVLFRYAPLDRFGRFDSSVTP